jgi:aspartyl-tRNA(Asn)/glutamyl-tRNA(Gln) amidotransferase subunit C
MSDANRGSETGIDVRYVARLARVYLTDAETSEFQAQLDQIVAHFNHLRQVDVSGVEPTAHAIQVQNVFRPDEPRESLDPAVVLANAPSHRNGHFIVPKIVE